jgi:hypothetical protein
MERALERYRSDIEQFQKSTGENVLDFQAGADEELNRSTRGKIKNKTTNEGGSVSAGGGMKGQGFAAGGSAAYSKNRQRSETDYREESSLQRALDTFQRSTGITLVRAEGGTHFVPKQMTVCRVRNSVAEITSDLVTGVYLGIAVSDFYLHDSPFYAHWNQDILDQECVGK